MVSKDIRWPGERVVDALHLDADPRYSVVSFLMDRDAAIVAPARLAALYRWLPRTIGLRRDAPASYFIAWLGATQWSVAWVSPGYFAWRWCGRSYSLFTRKAWPMFWGTMPFRRFVRSPHAR